MPWRERTCMSERREFVVFAGQAEANISALCRQYGISRKTGYKWLRRSQQDEAGQLVEGSRRPLRSPRQTPAEVQARVCALREEHPAWGGRKLHHVLRREGVEQLPAPSTITSILSRNGLLRPDRRLERDWQRFEAEAPNALWQMDFKGPIATQAGACYVLTVLDDHSRFSIRLAVCATQQRETVQTELIGAFERYGLPERMLMDNGPPWGSGYTGQPFTRLAAWLIRHGVSVSHGRPYHPQTQGKDERFHRTLALEVIASRPVWHDAPQFQADCDAWREVYNLRRPHEALANEPPASRYRPSARPYTSQLPAIEYAPDDVVRWVQQKGLVSFRGRRFLVSRAFVGEPVALRPVGDGVWDVYYCYQPVGRLDLTHSPDVEV